MPLLHTHTHSHHSHVKELHTIQVAHTHIHTHTHVQHPHVNELHIVQVAVSDGFVHLLVVFDAFPEVFYRLHQN